MDELRTQVRRVLIEDPGNFPRNFKPGRDAVSKCDLPQVWQNVESYDHSSHLNRCESIASMISYVEYFQPWSPDDGSPIIFTQDQNEALNKIFKWASAVVLPSAAYSVEFVQTESDEPTADIKRAQDESRWESDLALQLLTVMTKLLGSMSGRLPDDVAVADFTLALACTVNPKEPWTSNSVHTGAALLQTIWLTALEDRGNKLWSALEVILKERIKPLFAKTPSPAITAAGRKNFHPLSLPRFDSMDESNKPWKTTDVYVGSALTWMIDQYSPEDKKHLEEHFPLYVPAILAMIDDSNMCFKTMGCELIKNLLRRVKACKSDILQRTNLTSVFEEAITPVLLSLPSITPEESSIFCLSEAYPALLALFQTAYQNPTSKNKAKDTEKYYNSLSKVLRSNIISSLHHISSSTPAAASTQTSFPYPRLSAQLITMAGLFVEELGINTVKYLQDLIPIFYTTLSNPFGFEVSHLGLTLSAAMVLQGVIKNGHPRIWRWRSELLSGLSTAWIHAAEDTSTSDEEKGMLEHELKVAVQVLLHVLQNPVTIPGDNSQKEQMKAKTEMVADVKKFVGADPILKPLFF
ncbi:hypothetical protein PENANT_c001G00043 [Penicillium antarcticum]|uniref:Uncharacterized protein n=1 Tax=Penicillium antarcticum TaxID=416450 RepID=A0A1V6QP14_9EURO|nr:uncharacterized protein N7508_010477 [Penicillium antarcticum]KAJ5295656.1 hypothetical protein N7508_010477 [Penicillium antarcticum]OQD90980.1 hypothetical protein PENANT_c001G00043 [Penicillium antarcticum]